MDRSIFGSDADLRRRGQLLSARRVQVNIVNGIPSGWGDVYSIGWTVWFSYLEIPNIEEHHSTVWLPPGQSTVVYSNQPANADGGPCCKSIAWEFRVKGSGQTINDFENAPAGRCYLAKTIGVEPAKGFSEATMVEVQLFGGTSTSPQ